MRSLTDVRRAVVPLISVVTVAAGYWLYWEPTGGIVESLSVYSSRWLFNGSVFHLVHMLVTSNEIAHAICAGATLLWALGISLLDRPVQEKIFLIFLGIVVFAPVVHPWYLTWIAALLTMRWSTAVFLLLGLSNLSNLVVLTYRRTGVWEESTLLLLIEYVPFYAALAWEFARGGFHHYATLTRRPRR
jgi:hypothetical protein